MGLLEFFRLLLVGDDYRTPQPSMAQLTIISTDAAAKRSSGSR